MHSLPLLLASLYGFLYAGVLLFIFWFFPRLMCVLFYVRAYVFTFVHTYLRSRIRLYVRANVFTFTHTFLRSHERFYVRVHLCALFYMQFWGLFLTSLPLVFLDLGLLYLFRSGLLEVLGCSWLPPFWEVRPLSPWFQGDMSQVYP